MQPERKIIQIAATEATEFGVITALCDDGTVWQLISTPSGEWSALPPIPQDASTGNSEGE